ncbi:MAG: nucleoside/nucleotide kinase family protein [Solirubrobacteraceae bacterium]
MTPGLRSLAGRVRALGGAGARCLLGIAGAPGAGKSTFATLLAAEVDAVVVPMDGFHRSNEELRRLGRLDRKGAQDTFDASGYVALLRRLRADPGAVPAPGFDRVAEAVVQAAITIPPGALVITEGNYLLVDESPWREVPGLLDEIWFVDVDEAARIERLVARFLAHGWDPAVARERVERGSDAENAALVTATRARADLIVRL